MAPGVAETVRITALGHRGDGLADTPTGPVYVPYTLAGELAVIDRRGERGTLVEIVERSPERALPACRHFHQCGGCALQMMSLADTRGFKRQLVIGALESRGLETPVDETIGVDPASRRRAVLTAVRTGKRILLGYKERRSDTLVDVEHCPVLVPAIVEQLGILRQLLAALITGHKPARVTVLATRTGLDVDVRDVARPARLLPDIVALCQAGEIVRLTIGGETLLAFAEPLLEVSGVAVVPPPGAFVQASGQAEAAMSALVVQHLRGAKRVADLFSGFGTFALALARSAQVTAIESSQPALAALERAARGAAGLRGIRTERRDLFGFALGASELARFDGIVFDPPRAGAEAQAHELARSKVPRVAAVSCNPASFARDAGILVGGGYRLQRVVPVDQFVYSAETEVVGLFAR